MGGSKNKAGYFDKLKGLLEDYRSIFIVEIDNVSSQQMHEIRHSLRGDGVVLMGKNTMVREWFGDKFRFEEKEKEMARTDLCVMAWRDGRTMLKMRNAVERRIV
jgi:ribosomal protein L10